MIIAVCSFVLWVSYMTFNGSQAQISEIPSSTHPSLAVCQMESDAATKRMLEGGKSKGLTITYKCLPDTIDPRVKG
jgi:hypothetical protein